MNHAILRAEEDAATEFPSILKMLIKKINITGNNSLIRQWWYDVMTSRSRSHSWTPQYRSVIFTIDWCCFYYFVRNSLVALQEAQCARIFSFRFVNISFVSEFFLFWVCVCARSLTKPFFRLSQPGKTRGVCIYLHVTPSANGCVYNLHYVHTSSPGGCEYIRIYAHQVHMCGCIDLHICTLNLHECWYMCLYLGTPSLHVCGYTLHICTPSLQYM